MEPARFAPPRSGPPFHFNLLSVARLSALSLTLCLVGLQLGPARAADLPITLISVTSPAAPFSDATLTVSTTPGELLNRRALQTSCTTNQVRRGLRASYRRWPTGQAA